MGAFIYCGTIKRLKLFLVTAILIVPLVMFVTMVSASLSKNYFDQNTTTNNIGQNIAFREIKNDLPWRELKIDYKVEKIRFMENSLLIGIIVSGEIENGEEKLALILTHPCGQAEDLTNLDRDDIGDYSSSFTKKSIRYYLLEDPKVGNYILTLENDATGHVVARREINLFLIGGLKR